MMRTAARRPPRDRPGAPGWSSALAPWARSPPSPRPAPPSSLPLPGFTTGRPTCRTWSISWYSGCWTTWASRPRSRPGGRGVAERELQALLEFAVELTHPAEPHILSRYRNPTVTRKPDGTEVTDADKKGEEVMRELIGRRHPDHAILGEEFGATGSESAEWRWVLDPIDGTAAFSLGIPLFGTLVGLLRRGDPVVGVVHLPAIGETLYAGRRLGCWFHVRGSEHVRARVRPVTALRDAVVMGPSGLASLPPDDT